MLNLEILKKIKIRNVEIKTSDLLDEKSAIEESIKFQNFFENWLKNNEFKYTNNKKYFDVTENEFWAARHYGEFRTKQATLNFISMWKNNRSKNLDPIINKLNKLGSDQSNKNLDESEDLDSTIRSNGQIVAYQNFQEVQAQEPVVLNVIFTIIPFLFSMMQVWTNIIQQKQLLNPMV